MRRLLAALAALAACSPDITSSVGDATGVDVRDTILVPTPDVPTPPEDTGTSVEDTSTSTSVEDTSVEDTSTSTSIEDTSVEDTNVEDTSAEDTAIEPDPFAPGDLVYDKIGNVLAIDDLRRVRWDASGDFALILGTGNKVLRYDGATRALSLAGTLGTTLADLDAANEGGWFLVAGVAAGKSTLWRVSLDDQGALVVADTLAVPNGTARAVTVEPGSNPSRFAIGAAGATMYIGYLYTFTLKDGLSAAKGFNSSAGIADVMWGDPAIQAGYAHLITSEGENGAGSHSWIIGAPDVVGNGWGGGFGNSGAAAWRPGGSYGMTTGWSSNKLYVYDGAWSMATLPVPTGASPNAIDWRDQRRALVVGRVIGSPPYAVVVDIREGDAATWTATFSNQSIQAFDQPPWSGNTSSMHLLDVDWRPAVACDEGLIVGTDNGDNSSPSYGLAIRFHDGSDSACSP